MTATLERPRSGVVGINWHAARQCWMVRKTHLGFERFLGRFETLDDAKAALDAWTPEAQTNAEEARAAQCGQPRRYAPQAIHPDGFPTLKRTRLTDEQVAYAVSIAHTIRGF